MKRRQWTDEDADRLERMWTGNVALDEICAALGRPAGSVVAKKAEMGVRRTRPLITGKVKEAIRLAEGGMPIKEVASATGLTLKTVEYRVRIAGTVLARSRLHTRILPYDDDLLRFRAQGLSMAETARRLGLAFWKVQTRLITLDRRAAIRAAREAA